MNYELVFLFLVFLMYRITLNLYPVPKNLYLTLKSEDPLPLLEKGKIPKIIWTYWDKPMCPRLVLHCMNRMRSFHPDWSLIVLNDQNISKYVDDDILHFRWSDTPPRKSDFIRLAVTEKYGGFWCDGSLLLNESLDWVLAKNVPFIGYTYISNKTRAPTDMIESWFYACAHGSEFVRLWKEEFYKINNYDKISEYLKSLQVDVSDLGSSKEYLTIHVACLVARGKVPEDSFSLIRADSSALKYVFKALDTATSYYQLYNEGINLLQYDYQPIIKFIRQTREVVEYSPWAAHIVYYKINSLS